MTFKQTLHKAGMTLKKHSPAIFTGVGVIGLGATAYLAYKSRDKVEAVVNEIERKNDLEIPVNKVEVAKDIAEAIYLPVAVGALAVTSILFAHNIQNNRIKMLVGTLAVEQARNIYFEKKYKEQHGEEEYTKFVTPTDEVEHIEVDKKGKEKITVKQVKKEIDETIGQWYDESSEYVSDDHTYNVAFIDSVTDKLQNILFQRGTLTLNEVREALGFDRIRNGALLGWSTSDSFDIEKSVMVLGDDEMGALKENIWVTWSRPRYIYDDIEFNGRYSI
jgi:hypothetical protein